MRRAFGTKGLGGLTTTSNGHTAFSVAYELAGECGSASIHPGATFEWEGTIQLKRLSESSSQFVGP